MQVEETSHSELGASSAHRWMACPGSVRACRGGKNVTTEFAALGTAAHELGSTCLTTGQPIEAFAGKTIKVPPNFEFEVDDDMIEAVSVYVDYVQQLAGADRAISFIETEFSLAQFDERLWGRNDAIVYMPTNRTLWVIDYKHGQGVPVSVENNSQLKYYALGAMLKIDQPIESVELVIVQPRGGGANNGISTWATTPMELMTFAHELVDAAKRTEDPDAPLVLGDHQCRFCGAAATCPARRNEAYETANALFTRPADPESPMELMDPAEVGDNYMAVVMERAARIEDWVAAVRARAHQMAVEGRPPQGYKLVDKVARRKWMKDDLDILIALTSAGVESDALYSKKLVSPAQAEKLIGKARFSKTFGKDIVDAVSSGTVLAPLDDKRPAVISQRDPNALFGKPQGN